MKKKLLVPITFLTVAAVTLIGLLTKEVSHTVTINKNIKDVWTYASDSTKANEWSVYFSHISPLPGVNDGKVGSLRRCFRRSNETGPRWDEEVVELKPKKYRQIRTFNLKNFNADILKLAQFKVHQRYEFVDENTTKLTFASSLMGPWRLDLILALLPSMKESKRIFKLNLENIKAAIEQGDDYKRPHPYEPKNQFDMI